MDGGSGAEKPIEIELWRYTESDNVFKRVYINYNQTFGSVTNNNQNVVAFAKHRLHRLQLFDGQWSAVIPISATESFPAIPNPDTIQTP